jgi:TM2 domain-containing membrane protein YozV
MSKSTRIIGWIVLAITEVLVIIAFFYADNKGDLLGYQLSVLTLVWGVAAYKNHIDLKREINGFHVPDKART